MDYKIQVPWPMWSYISTDGARQNQQYPYTTQDTVRWQNIINSLTPTHMAYTCTWLPILLPSLKHSSLTSGSIRIAISTHISGIHLARPFSRLVGPLALLLHSKPPHHSTPPDPPNTEFRPCALWPDEGFAFCVSVFVSVTLCASAKTNRILGSRITSKWIRTA